MTENPPPPDSLYTDDDTPERKMEAIENQRVYDEQMKAYRAERVSAREQTQHDLESELRTFGDMWAHATLARQHGDITHNEFIEIKDELLSRKSERIVSLLWGPEQ